MRIRLRLGPAVVWPDMHLADVHPIGPDPADETLAALARTIPAAMAVIPPLLTPDGPLLSTPTPRP